MKYSHGLKSFDNKIFYSLIKACQKIINSRLDQLTNLNDKISNSMSPKEKFNENISQSIIKEKNENSIDMDPLEDSSNKRQPGVINSLDQKIFENSTIKIQSKSQQQFNTHPIQIFNNFGT